MSPVAMVSGFLTVFLSPASPLVANERLCRHGKRQVLHPRPVWPHLPHFRLSGPEPEDTAAPSVSNCYFATFEFPYGVRALGMAFASMPFCKSRFVRALVSPQKSPLRVNESANSLGIAIISFHFILIYLAVDSRFRNFFCQF